MNACVNPNLWTIPSRHGVLQGRFEEETKDVNRFIEYYLIDRRPCDDLGAVPDIPIRLARALPAFVSREWMPATMIDIGTQAVKTERTL